MRPDYVRPSAQWPNEITPGAADWARFDQAQCRSITTDGGTWNPAGPIVIGGTGLQLGNVASQLVGGLSTEQGSRLVLDGGDYPSTLPSRNDTVVAPLIVMRAPGTSLLVDATTMNADPSAFGIGASGGIPSICYVPKRYIHNGSQLLRVTLSFRLTARPTAVPTDRITVLLVGDPADGINSTNYQLLNPGSTASYWSPSTPYGVGSYVWPSNYTKLNGFYYKAITSGTSGVSEPVWPTTIGAGVLDNGFTWQCKGRAGQLPYTTNLDTLYNQGQPQTMTLDLDFPNWTMDTSTYRYMLGVAQPAEITSLVIHSATFEFNASRLGPE